MRISSTAAMALLLGASLAGCRVSGEGWLAVYGTGPSAEDQVTFSFEASCDSSAERPEVRVTFRDREANVDFEGEVAAEVCRIEDPYTEAYGTYRGVYYVRTDSLGAAEGESGEFSARIVDRGDLGYSLRDFFCLYVESGPYEGYALPVKQDLDDDGVKDPGCAYFGAGRIRLDVLYSPRNEV